MSCLFSIRRSSKGAPEKHSGSSRPMSWQENDKPKKDKSRSKRLSAAEPSVMQAPPGDRTNTQSYTSKTDSLASYHSMQSLNNSQSVSSELQHQHKPEYTSSSSTLPQSVSWHPGAVMSQSSISLSSPVGAGASVGPPPPLEPRSRRGYTFDALHREPLSPRQYGPDFYENEKENRPSPSHSAQDVRHTEPVVSGAYRSPYSRDHLHQPPWSNRPGYHRYNNYENIDKFDHKGGAAASLLKGPMPYSSSLSNISSSPRYSSYPDNKEQNRDISSTSHLPVRPKDKESDIRPPVSDSPPAPPVRDASSLKYIKVSQSHEKYPSWPVSQQNQNKGDDESKVKNGSRTNSWAPSTTTSQEFPKKPKMAYQPQLDTTMEEKNPKEFFREEKGKSGGEPPFRAKFIQEALACVEGQAYPTLESGPYPLDTKGELELKNLYNAHTTYPFPLYDRDGRELNDKDYAVPSPPERDIPIEHREEGLRKPDIEPLSTEAIIDTSADTSTLDDFLHKYHKDNDSNGRTSPPPLPSSPPPLPQTAPPPMATASSTSSFPSASSQSSQQMVTMARSPLHSSYTYIVRNKPFYNTGTQTDTMAEPVDYKGPSASAQTDANTIYEPTFRHVECQTDMDHVTVTPAPTPMSTLERRRANKSDVSTQIEPIKESLAMMKDRESHDLSTQNIPQLSSTWEQQRGSGKMEQRRIPETIEEVSFETSSPQGAGVKPVTPAKQSKNLNSVIIQQINEHSLSQTWMLRKLSQEFFGGKKTGLGYTSRRPGGVLHSSVSEQALPPTRAAENHKHFHSTSQPVGSYSNYQHIPQADEYKRRSLDHENPNQERSRLIKSSSKEFISPDSEVQKLGVARPQGKTEHGNGDNTTEDKNVLPSQLLMKGRRSHDGTYKFDRKSRNKMSLKKAYGIFDEIESFNDKSLQRTLGSQGKSKSTSHVPIKSANADRVEVKDVNKQSKTVTDTDTTDVKLPIPDDMPVSKHRSGSLSARSGSISARTEWDVKDKTTSLTESPKKLKRTSSEQIRPMKERQREKATAEGKHKISDPKVQEKRHKTSDPTQFDSPHVRHRSSDPSMDVLRPHSTSRRSSDHENQRLSTISIGSDIVFQGTNYDLEPRAPSAAMSTSSSSLSEETRQRLSDPELKKLQQKAVLNFYEKKTGKRLSTSSMESGLSDKTTPKERYGSTSPGWRERSPSPQKYMDNESARERDRASIMQAMKKSKSLPRDMSSSAGPTPESGPERPSSAHRERRRSGQHWDYIHKKEKSAPSHLESYALSQPQEGSTDIGRHRSSTSSDHSSSLDRRSINADKSSKDVKRQEAEVGTAQLKVYKYLFKIILQFMTGDIVIFMVISAHHY